MIKPPIKIREAALVVFELGMYGCVNVPCNMWTRGRGKVREAQRQLD